MLLKPSQLKLKPLFMPKMELFFNRNQGLKLPPCSSQLKVIIELKILLNHPILQVDKLFSLDDSQHPQLAPLPHAKHFHYSSICFPLILLFGSILTHGALIWFHPHHSHSTPNQYLPEEDVQHPQPCQNYHLRQKEKYLHEK